MVIGTSAIDIWWNKISLFLYIIMGGIKEISYIYD